MKEVEGEPLDTLYTRKRYTMVDRSHYEEVVQGMRSAVLGGTCRGANLPDIEVCGKPERHRTVEKTTQPLWDLLP